MANILTNLRELSVAFFLNAPSSDPKSITPQIFAENCNRNITHCKITVNNIASDLRQFNQAEKAVIINGFNLAIEFRKILGIIQTPNIQWVGNHKKSDSPEDLIVNDYKLSLKEESFILENMGLYKLLNIISNSELHRRGLHVFETFAERELFNWYETTRDLLIQLGPKKFNYSGTGYISEGTLLNDTLTLMYNNTSCKIKNYSTSTYADFMTNTNSLTREKVFSKWINENVKQSQKYNKSKSECSQSAGNSIIAAYEKFIGTSSDKLLRLFRIHDYSYYYAKTTYSSVEIYKVPSIQESLRKIIINKFYCLVPDSQLNIFTEILNSENGKTFLFRNELRYSHGQFNGTPEAKLYHVRDGDLSVMYNKLL